jgi:hypothetical protein
MRRCSPPDVKASKGERFGPERQRIGCEAQHDLVFARAREPINTATYKYRHL